ncbi:hypothetical protein RPB_3072 [Rhodopseudomonas palustris HaA2]|uniref:Uncharacterized protein n=2 Tax=Rhodopseudomonas palustris TaxID=1076 RepID=Q2IVI7_RHOP2|nr:hypothetical protein RPB_3072 [Rhodopseudomonas palustris HaA2]
MKIMLFRNLVGVAFAAALPFVAASVPAQAQQYTLGWIEVGGSYASKPYKSNQPFCVLSNPKTCACNNSCGKKVPLNNEVAWFRDGCQKPPTTIRCVAVGDNTQNRKLISGQQVTWSSVGAWKVQIQTDKTGQFNSCFADLTAAPSWKLRISQSYKAGPNYTRVLTGKETYVFDKSGAARAGGGQQPASFSIGNGPVRQVMATIEHAGGSLRTPWSDELLNGPVLHWQERGKKVDFQLGNVRRVVQDLGACTMQSGEH